MPSDAKLPPDATTEALLGRIEELEDALASVTNRYRQMFQTNLAIKLVIDPDDGRILEANPAAVDFYGFPEKELTSKRITDLNTLTEAEVREEMARARSEDRLFFNFRHRIASGEIRDVEVYSGPINLDGKVRLYSIIHDVTARIAAERELLREKQRMEGFLTATNIGTWEWNIPTGDVTYNERWAEICGYTLAELGTPSIETWTRLAHPEDLALSQEHLQRHWDGLDALYDVQLRMRHKDGHWVWVRDRGKVLSWTEDGAPLLMFGTHSDITAQKAEAEAKLELERHVQQAQKLESLGILAGGIAHDFNNILTAIKGHAELAGEDIPGAHPSHRWLSTIMEGVERAQYLTRQMLSYSGRGVVSVTDVDLSRFVEDTRSVLRSSIPPAIVLEADLAENLPPVLVDASQLRQVVVNLVTNAAEAYPEGAAGHVRISTRVMECDGECISGSGSVVGMAGDPTPGTYVCLEVSDDGAGMDTDTLDRIFDPFFTTKFQGRGLGMAAVLGVVSAHHGFISVRSEPRVGTTFQVLLPPGEDPSVQSGTPDQRSGAGTPRQVLVVDDEDWVRSLVKTALERRGYVVHVAVDGKEGLERFRSDPDAFACVLLDLTMPRMSGPRCMEEMRRIRPALPVVITSGFSGETVQRALPQDQAANAYLPKPFSLAALHNAIRTVTETRGA